MTEQVSNALLGAMTLCAVVVTVVVVKQQIAPPPDAAAELTFDRPPVDNWQSFGSRGHRFGPVDAEVTIVEFSDFQCSFCRAFSERVLPRLLKDYSEKVAVIYRHFPLEAHRYAQPLALASECAAEKGHFNAFHDAVFAAQDSLSYLPPLALALRAGIPDTADFLACVTTRRYADEVAADIEAAASLGATGTPLFLVNGRVLRGLVRDSTFFRMLDEVLERK